MQKIQTKQFRDNRIIQLGLSGMTIEGIANEVGVGRKIVTNALYSDKAQSLMQQTLDDLDASINSKLPTLLPLALNTIESLLNNPNSTRSEKLQAAKVILTTSIRLSELSLKKPLQGTADNVPN